MKVRQLMTRPALTCSAEASLQHAAQLMWEHDCGALPVVGLDGRVVGVVTDRDACMAAYTQGLRLGEIPVQRAMSQRAVTCSPEDSVDHAGHLMLDHQLRRLVVVDAAGRALGMIALSDLVRAAETTSEGALLQPRAAQISSAIARPRPPVPHGFEATHPPDPAGHVADHQRQEPRSVSRAPGKEPARAFDPERVRV